MEITTKKLKLSQIKPNPTNPRKIGKVEMERLVKSLQDFPEMLELREIIVDENNTILGGNMRYRALKKIGEKECIAKIVTGLTVDQKREFIIKDNSNFGSYDMDALANLWSDSPLVEWGVDLPEDWMGGDKTEVKEDDFDAEAAAESISDPIAKPGDVWVMDRHRLCCGDATNPQDYEKLMAGATADLVWTDPPYGVSYTDKADWINNKRKGTSHKPIAGDNLRGGGLQTMLEDAFKNTAAHSKPGACVYVAHADINTAEFRGALNKAGIYVSQTLVWVKSGAVLSRNDYNWKHEPILYGWNEGAGHYFSQNFTETSVIDDDLDLDKMKKEDLIALLKEMRSAQPETVLREDRPTKNSLHPTMKPIALVARMIRNSTRPDPSQIVLDPFMGSGTTLMAAEQTGRTAYGMEIDPVYCDVIVQRWEKLTGKKAVLDERS